MKAAVILAVFAFAGSCATAPGGQKSQETTGGALELRTIHSGSYAAVAPAAPEAIAAVDEASYRQQWSAIAASGEPPHVDFTKESVVFLLAGSKPTGGWSVVPQSVALEGETLVVTATVKGPGPESIVTQAFTSPFAVIAVSAKFRDVRWKPSLLQ